MISVLKGFVFAISISGSILGIIAAVISAGEGNVVVALPLFGASFLLIMIVFAVLESHD